MKVGESRVGVRKSAFPWPCHSLIVRSFPCRVEHVNGVVKHQLFIVIL